MDRTVSRRLARCSVAAIFLPWVLVACTSSTRSASSPQGGSTAPVHVTVAPQPRASTSRPSVSSVAPPGCSAVLPRSRVAGLEQISQVKLVGKSQILVTRTIKARGRSVIRLQVTDTNVFLVSHGRIVGVTMRPPIGSGASTVISLTRISPAGTVLATMRVRIASCRAGDFETGSGLLARVQTVIQRADREGALGPELSIVSASRLS